MKKLIAVLAVAFTMATATACDFDKDKSLSSLNSENGGNQQVEDPNEGGNENEENDNVVSPITGGGDFNTKNNYND